MSNVMYPALRKLYKDDDDKLQEALRKYYFSIHISISSPFIYQSSSGYAGK